MMEEFIHAYNYILYAKLLFNIGGTLKGVLISKIDEIFDDLQGCSG
ncbi:hypothetical protein [Candidatus Enterovibrio escicola]|nr:hypothetical protein [Candidatus Enterovibrio escacola]